MEKADSLSSDPSSGVLLSRKLPSENFRVSVDWLRVMSPCGRCCEGGGSARGWWSQSIFCQSDGREGGEDYQLMDTAGPPVWLTNTTQNEPQRPSGAAPGGDKIPEEKRVEITGRRLERETQIRKVSFNILGGNPPTTYSYLLFKSVFLLFFPLQFQLVFTVSNPWLKETLFLVTSP